MENQGLAANMFRDYAIPRSSPLRRHEAEAVTDEEVIARVCDGDIEAFGIFVAKYENFVFTLVRGLVGSDEAAKDVSQETFLRAYRALRRFESRSSFKTWLYRIAYNTAMNHIRKYGTPNDRGVDEPASIGIKFEDIPLRLTIKKLVDSLKPEHRAIIMLHYYDDLKYQEIAEVLGCPVGTVKIRLFRAKYELKLLWQKYAI